MTELNTLVVFKIVEAKSFSAAARFGGKSHRLDLRRNQRLCGHKLLSTPVAWVRPFMAWIGRTNDGWLLETSSL
jgi:hypothetical protein